MSTSTTTTTLKLQLNDEIRRISLNAPLSLRAIQLRAADLFGVADVATIRFTYVDSDGDAITVGSDGDLSEAIAHFHGKPIKFNVVVSAVSATQPKPTVVEPESPKVESKSPEAKPTTTPAAPKNLSEFVDSIVNDSELQTLARNFGVSLEGSLSDIVAQAASNPLIAQLIQDFRRPATDSNDDDDDDDEDDSESSGEEAVEKNVPVVNGDGEAKPIHNAFCDGCRVRIQGVRYKCAVCADFDFCEKCQVFAGEKHPTSHSFYKIERPAPFFGNRQGPYWTRAAAGNWHGPTGQNGPCGPRPHHGPHPFHGRCQRWQQFQQQQQKQQAAAAPAPAAPAAAAPAAAPVTVQYELEHVTVAAGSPLPAGQEVVKLFKVKNVSGEEWPQSTALVFASGVRVGDFRIPVGKVPAGEERYIAVDVKAPETAGRAVSAYRLQHGSGAIQGEPLVIDFVVVSN